MNTSEFMKRLSQAVMVVLLLLTTTAASAEDVLGYLTNQDGKYTGPTVEDNVITMDTDKNGFADVFEVRAFLQLKHGKNYQVALLDKWEASAKGKSCSTPFAKELYSDKSY
jgi:hypothetical protein